jgi:hypothetical protein
MEIKEIVTYYVNTETNILEVSFRTIEDSDDTVRTDYIDYSLVNEYGYELESQDLDFFGLSEDDEEEELKESDIELDEHELLNFLNEYYTVNPDSVPESEIH